MKAWVRVPLIYFLFAAPWIAVSDHVTALLFPDQFEAISVYKGCLFAGITTLLLLVLLRSETRKRDGVETRLRSLLANDPLTGLCNRVSFSEALERAVAQAQRDHGQVSVLFLDLDGFKAVNDCHGHHMGDALLREVGLRISDITRTADCAGRFGGDEFVVLLRAGRHGTEILARRLLEGLREPYCLPNGVTLALTASIGFAIFPDDGQEGGQLLRAADQAMYRVKSGRKNAVAAAGGNRPTATAFD